MPDICIREGCEKTAIARQQCSKHYYAERRQKLKEDRGVDDPRLVFCQKLGALLNTAPEGMLSDSDRELIVAIAWTAAATARGIIPITPDARRKMLRDAVDALPADSTTQ